MLSILDEGKKYITELYLYSLLSSTSTRQQTPLRCFLFWAPCVLSREILPVTSQDLGPHPQEASWSYHQPTSGGISFQEQGEKG